jgi:hypothetical protein
MTASVCVPQRWQSISATAGISVLPLVLMYLPPWVHVPGVGNLARKDCSFPAQPRANLAPALVSPKMAASEKSG